MLVILVHHGEAVDPDVDPQRPLSVRGHGQVRELAERVAGRGVKPAAIWHSGKLRARQTAESYWRACNPSADFVAVRGLQPADPVDWIRNTLLREQRDLMLVGHMPHLPHLLRALLSREVEEEAPVAFPQHGVVAIEMAPEGTCVEAWRLEPGPDK